MPTIHATLLSGPLATRPTAAASAGKQYLETDTGVVSQSNGTVWTAVPNLTAVVVLTLTLSGTLAYAWPSSTPTAGTVELEVTPTVVYDTLSTIPAGSFVGQVLFLRNVGLCSFLIGKSATTVAATVNAATTTMLVWGGVVWAMLQAGTEMRVEDFGATGDGTTDDGPAIQACIDASSSSAIIRFRARVYGTSMPIKLIRGRVYTGFNSTGGGDQNSYPTRGTVIRALPSFNSAGTEYAQDHILTCETSWSTKVASITRVATVATVTTQVAHTLKTGAYVSLRGATGADAAIYNATAVIATVTSPTTFTYTLSSTPAASAVGTLVQIGADWMHWTQVLNLALDGNQANGAIAGGFKCFNMGEEFLLQNTSVWNAARGGYTFMGSHAVGLVLNNSAWYCYNYGLKFIDNLGGVARVWGFSGDKNSPGHQYYDGGRVSCHGTKNEVRRLTSDLGVFTIAGVSTGGNRGEITCDGGSTNFSSNGGVTTETGRGACAVVTIPNWSWELGAAITSAASGTVNVSGTQTIFTNGRYVVGRYLRVGGFSGQTVTIDAIASDTLITGTVGVAAASLTRVGTLATYTTAFQHGLISGTSPTIAGAAEAQYNGTFVITVTSPTTFTYVMASDPGATATGAPRVLTGTTQSVNTEIESLCTTQASVHITGLGANGALWSLWDRVNGRKIPCPAGAVDELKHCPDGNAVIDVYSGGALNLSGGPITMQGRVGNNLTLWKQITNAGGAVQAAYQVQEFINFANVVWGMQVTQNRQTFMSLDIATINAHNILRFGSDAARFTMNGSQSLPFSSLPVPGSTGSAASVAANGCRFFANNARKGAEGSGAGTGCEVYWNNPTAQWLRLYDNAAAGQ